MKSALDSFPALGNLIRGADLVLLGLDYDGTLVPIAKRPELATLSARSRSRLEAFARDDRFVTAVISGRSLKELRGKVALEGIVYAGNHGLELEGPGLSYLNPAARAARPLLKKLSARLGKALADVPGVWVENKGFSLSVHFRLVPKADIPRVFAVIDQIARPYLRGRKIALARGKMVVEIRPPGGWGKGKIVNWLLRRLRTVRRRVLPVYLGDDATDEDAFQALEGDGIAIRVGKSDFHSRAEYFLRSPAEVATFLGKLLGSESSRTGNGTRVGILGGTFNPVHRGHLEIARAARESFRLDRIYFIPAALPPHKNCPDLAPGSDRARMLELALAGLAPYSIWRGELERGGVSYTIATVRSLRRLLGKRAELFLIVGWDNLAEISAWKEILSLLRLCRFIGVTRPGCPARGKTSADEKIIRRLLGEGRENLLELEIPVSSSEVRARLRAGEPVGDLLPGRVEKYIRETGLYDAPKEKS